jgi:hypothetical protein
VRYDLRAAEHTDEREDLSSRLACLTSPPSVPVCRNESRAADIRGKLGMVLGVSCRLSVFNPAAATLEDRGPASGLRATRNSVVVSDQQGRHVWGAVGRQLPTEEQRFLLKLNGSTRDDCLIK